MTPCLASARAAAATPSMRTFTGMTAAPVSSAGYRSGSAASKAKEASRLNRSVSSMVSAAIWLSTMCSRVRWVCATALGRPVEPEVNST